MKSFAFERYVRRQLHDRLSPSTRRFIWYGRTSALAYASLGVLAARRGPAVTLRARELMQQPIILGGCGRSGTTLLLSVLSCHPKIHAIPNETLAFCPDRYAPLPGSPLPFRLDYVYRELLTTDIAPTCTRVAEKTPKNVVTFGRILERFGDGARLIHIVRDGRAVVASKHPGRPGEYYVSAERWVEDVSAGLALEGHPCVLTLRYEDLICSYEETTRRLCGFIGETWTRAFLDFPESARIRNHPAWSGDVGTVSAQSLDKWRAPEHHDAVARLLALPRARALLERLGYVD